MGNLLLLHDAEQNFNHIRASIKTTLLRYVPFSYTVVFSEATVYMYNKTLTIRPLNAMCRVHGFSLGIATKEMLESNYMQYDCASHLCSQYQQFNHIARQK